MVQESSYDLDI